MPTLPGVGKVSKGWMIAVAAVSAGVIGYAYYKHRQTAASPATTASTSPAMTGSATGDQYPPDGTYGDPTDPNSTDPQTGMTYGDESLYGGGYGGGYGQYGFGAGSYYPGTTGGSGGQQGPGAFSTNADWAQYAEQQLSGVVDATALSAALGKYLTGQAVTSDQGSLIDQAIAIAGYPPVAGAGNYPPNIKTGGGGGGGGSITGLRVSARETNVTAHWTAVSGASSYEMVVTDHQGAKTLGSVVTRTNSATVGHLPAKQSMAVHITAQPGGQTGTAYTATK